MFSREIHHFFHNIALRGFPFSAKSYLDGSRLSYLQKFYQSILMIFWNVKCNMDDDFFFCVFEHCKIPFWSFKRLRLYALYTCLRTASMTLIYQFWVRMDLPKPPEGMLFATCNCLWIMFMVSCIDNEYAVLNRH